jgi:hypothetical protein
VATLRGVFAGGLLAFVAIGVAPPLLEKRGGVRRSTIDRPSVATTAQADAPATPARDCSAPYPVSSRAGPPPFAGAAYVSNAIITEADPSSLASLTYRGVAERTMFDRRTARFQPVFAHVFDARFGANTIVEVQVNREFSQQDAERESRFYATAIGRLPAFLFRDLRTVWIHRGDFDFGGGNNNLMIHSERGAAHARQGVLEEILLHEATHTSFDRDHSAAPRWLEAQRADGASISAYARDNPNREDLAETLPLYLAQRVRPDRLSPAVVATIRATIAARIAYLDCVGLSMDPVR